MRACACVCVRVRVRVCVCVCEFDSKVSRSRVALERLATVQPVVEGKGQSCSH